MDILIGISRNMEKSLSSIDKNLTSVNTGRAGGTLANLAGGLSAITSSISSKSWSSKRADDIIQFTKNLVAVVNTTDAEKGRSFARFAGGLSSAVNTIIEIISPINLAKLVAGSKILFGGISVAGFSVKKSLLEKIIEGITKAFEKIPDPEKAKKGAEAVKAMASGLAILSGSLTKFALVGALGPLIAIGALVSLGIARMFAWLGIYEKEIHKGAKAMKDVASGLSQFAIGLATLLLVIMVARPSRIAEGLGVLAMFALTFALIGAVHKNIMDGIKTLAWMGLGLFAFSAALATFYLAIISIESIQKGMLLQGLGYIAGAAIAFALIGKFESQIRSGAVTMFEMGLALISFSAGLIVFGTALKISSAAELLLGTVAITAIGLSFAAIGKLEKFIRVGAEAAVEMGISLVALGAGLTVFGLSIRVWMDTFGNKIASAGLIAESILIGLGVAFAVIGKLGGSQIAEGAIGMIIAGGALISISAGIYVFSKAIDSLKDTFGKDLAEAGKIGGYILIGLGLAFAAIGAAASLIAPGAAAMIAVGISLISVSAGILIFAKSIEWLQRIFPGDSLMQAGKIGGNILLGLALAFAGVGFVAPLVFLGSVAMIAVGGALLASSIGVLAYALTIKKMKESNILDKDGNLLGLNILSSLAKQFSKIGLYALLPTTWTGVAFSIGMGVALFSIGAGLKKAEEALSSIGSGDKLRTFTDALFGEEGLLRSIAKNFKTIGKDFSGGFLANWLGTDDVSMGMKVVRGMGDALQSVAGGIVAFADFENFPVKVPDPKDPSKLIYQTVRILSDIIPAISENVPFLLKTLSRIFADIGEKFGGGDGWFAKKSPVQKGIDAVKGLGSVLSELAGGIVSFANFTEFPVQVPDPKDPSRLIYKAVNLMDTIPLIKTALVGDGDPNSGKGILFALSSVFADIGQKYPTGFFGGDSDVAKGVKAVQGIGGVVSELAGGIVSFATLTTKGVPEYDKEGRIVGYAPVNMEAVKANIANLITFLPGLFAKIDLGNISDAHKKVEVMDSMANVLQKFAKIGDGLSKFAGSLSDLGNSFVTFGAGFDKFAVKLPQFGSFATSMSNLIKVQQAYNFDKFADSMGKLKSNVNAFDLKKLEFSDSMMRSLAILAKNPDQVATKISTTLQEEFEKMIDAIRKIAGDGKEQKENTAQIAPVQQPTTVTLYNASNTQSSQNQVMQQQISDLMNKFDDLIKVLGTTNEDIALLVSKFKVGQRGALLVTNTP